MWLRTTMQPPAVGDLLPVDPVVRGVVASSAGLMMAHSDAEGPPSLLRLRTFAHVTCRSSGPRPDALCVGEGYSGPVRAAPTHPPDLGDRRLGGSTR